MDLDEFDYSLPKDLIAQEPLPRRDRSRLMVLDRAAGTILHRTFRDLVDFLRPPDVLVLNDTRVIPARIVGRRATGAVVEALVVAVEEGGCRCRLLARPGGRLKPGEVVTFEEGTIRLRLVERDREGTWAAESEGGDLAALLERVGRAPLPPYIRRSIEADGRREVDRRRYQTVFARRPGAVAAPTAGLHFTEALLADLRRRGVRQVHLTLHVGPGTFQPIRARRIEEHRMHGERYEFPASAAAACAEAREKGGRVVAVGTTSARTLETAYRRHGTFRPDAGLTDLYIHPPYRFQAVDALLTNFHLPKSTLLLLVCAFAGREFVLRAYREAVRLRYRFYSYGDAMLIV